MSQNGMTSSTHEHYRQPSSSSVTSPPRSFSNQSVQGGVERDCQPPPRPHKPQHLTSVNEKELRTKFAKEFLGLGDYCNNVQSSSSANRADHLRTNFVSPPCDANSNNNNNNSCCDTSDDDVLSPTTNARDLLEELPQHDAVAASSAQPRSRTMTEETSSLLSRHSTSEGSCAS